MPSRKKSSVKAKAKGQLDTLKYEVAKELGLPKEVFEDNDWGNLSARQCGAVGGQMVKRMIKEAQKTITKNDPQKE